MNWATHYHPGGVLPDKIPGYAAAAAENGGTRQ